MNFIKKEIISRGLFFSSIVGMVASLSANSHEGLAQQWFFEFLTREELAVVGGSQRLEKDVINLIHEHMRRELAAGRGRKEILAEIKDVIYRAVSDVELSTIENAILVGVGVASFVGGLFLAKLIVAQKASFAVCNLKQKPHHAHGIQVKPLVSQVLPLDAHQDGCLLPVLNDEDDIKSESSAGFSDEVLDLLVKPRNAKPLRRSS
jgi:hypothetical protein